MDEPALGFNYLFHFVYQRKTHEYMEKMGAYVGEFNNNMQQQGISL